MKREKVRTEKRHKRANSSLFYSPLSENLTWFHLRKTNPNEYPRGGRSASHIARTRLKERFQEFEMKKSECSARNCSAAQITRAHAILSGEREREGEGNKHIRFALCNAYSRSFIPFHSFRSRSGWLSEAGVCVSVTAALCFLCRFHRLI